MLSETDTSVCCSLCLANAVFSAVSRSGGKIKLFSYNFNTCSFLISGCVGEELVREESCSVSFKDGMMEVNVFSPMQKRLEDFGGKITDADFSRGTFSFDLKTSGRNLYSILRICEEESLMRGLFLSGLKVYFEKGVNVVKASFRERKYVSERGADVMSLVSRYSYLFEAARVYEEKSSCLPDAI